MRNYQNPDQIGLEPTLGEYHDRLLEVTSELKRVLKPTGVMFWIHGDSYGGSGGSGGDYNIGGLREGQPKVGKTLCTAPKCMAMQNERLIIKMIDERGWILRNRIVWHKSNGMPSSVEDRFTNKYEPVYMLVKSKKYWFDLDAVRIPAKYQEVWSRKGSGKDTPYDQNNPRKRCGLTKHEIATHRTSGAYSDPLHTKPIHPSGMKNHGDVWTIPTQPYPESHFATFPLSLIEPMIKSACPSEVCPECGHIRERIVDKDVINPRTINGVKDSNTRYCDGEPETGTRFGDVTRLTTGWTTCSCGKEFEPGVVLDCFSGAGTSLLAARDLGRSAIGIEISADYCKIAKKRVRFNQSTIDGSIKYIYREI